MFLARFAVLAFCLLAPVAGHAEGSQRVALVIGNSDYRDVARLRNPVNDASDIASALSRIGFDVTLEIDLDGDQMRASLKDFSKQTINADLSLLYFAGHGIEIDKINYLLPVDTKLARNQDAAFEAIELNSVVRAISESSGIKIILVDACRNNPFAQKLKSESRSRSIGTGLSRVDPVGGILSGGIMISYAAREGTFALDGQGRNSPYAQGLLEAIEQPNLEVGKLFRKVRDRVFDITSGQQEPFTYGSLPGSDIFLTQYDPKIESTRGPEEADNSSILTEFYQAEWSNSPYTWREFIERHSQTGRDNELVQIARERLVSMGAGTLLTTADRDNTTWLQPAAGFPTKGPVTLNLEERKMVQKALVYSGYDLGVIDGQFGRKTKDAISAARLNMGLTLGAFVDKNFLKRLPDAVKIDRLKSVVMNVQTDNLDLHALEPRLKKALTALEGQDIIFDYFEGRLYIAVNSGRSHWRQAYKLAKDAGGYLVTISNADENRFVWDLFSGESIFFGGIPPNLHGPHIGLVQGDKSNEPHSGWIWVTGEDLVFSSWKSGQPDDNRCRGCGLFKGDFARFSGPGKFSQRWNDSHGSGGIFVMEVD